MKIVYLSPSMQDDNIGVGEFGTEKDYCNKIADLVCEKFNTNEQVKIIRSNKIIVLSAPCAIGR